MHEIIQTILTDPTAREPQAVAKQLQLQAVASPWIDGDEPIVTES